MKALVEVVGTYHLKIDTGHHLDLLDTLLILVMDVSVYLSIIISLVLVFFVMVYIN